MHSFSNTTAILHLTGSLDASNISLVEAEMAQCLESHACNSLRLDMGRVELIDSAGLVCLVSGLKQARQLGKEFSLHNVAPAVHIILELTQLDRAFTVTADADVDSRIPQVA